MPVSRPTLSKSDYLSGMQCLKRLFLERSPAGPEPELTSVQQAALENGVKVGIAATKRYSDGTLISARQHKAARTATRAAMGNTGVGAVFEGAFDHNDIRVRVDILERRRGGKWRLLEVKSSTEVKDYHNHDVAVQYYVLKKNGVHLSDAGILHLNKTYARGDSGLDYQALFTFHSLRQDADSRLTEVPANVVKLRKALKAPREPYVSPGEQCGDPFECPYQDACVGTLDPFSPFNLPRGAALAAKGVTDIRSIPQDVRLSPLHKRACEARISNTDCVGPELYRELTSVTYPIHFLDFEAFSPVLPRYAGTRPYQVLPFQWSDHIINQNGRMRHEEFLFDSDGDPRKAFIESLLTCLGNRGTVCVYSSYEKSRLRELATAFPAYKRRIDVVIGRLWDLLGIIRNHYYHPRFGPSFSIKAVLPALTKLTYKDLTIHRGDEAALMYEQMIDAACSPLERKKLRRALLKYCERDTLAMVEVRKALLERCKKAR
jgi:hypothetical protein